MRWSEEAFSQLDEAREWVEQYNPVAARQMAEALIFAARRLEEFPYLGGASERPGLRKLVLHKPPFILVYAVDSPVVKILGVFHHARSRSF